MLEKLKNIYSFLNKEAIKKRKKGKSDYICILMEDLIKPEKEFKIDDKGIPLEDIRYSYDKLKVPYTRIEEGDLMIGQLYENYDIAFRCIRIDKYHYPSRNKDGYAVKYWVFKVDQILISNQDSTPHHLDLLSETTIQSAIRKEEISKRRINEKLILNTIDKFKEEGVDPTFNSISEVLNLNFDETADAIFALGEDNEIYWESGGSSVFQDEAIHLKR